VTPDQRRSLPFFVGAAIPARIHTGLSKMKSGASRLGNENPARPLVRPNFAHPPSPKQSFAEAVPS
jgi:hypothetical protein